MIEHAIVLITSEETKSVSGHNCPCLKIKNGEGSCKLTSKIGNASQWIKSTSFWALSALILFDVRCEMNCRQKYKCKEKREIENELRSLQ